MRSEGGVRGLYKGLGPTLLREVPGSAAMFAAYEALKISMAKQQVSGNLAEPISLGKHFLCCCVKSPFALVTGSMLSIFAYRASARVASAVRAAQHAEFNAGTTCKLSARPGHAAICHVSSYHQLRQQRQRRTPA